MIEREKKRQQLIIKYQKQRDILKKEIRKSQDFNKTFNLQNKLQQIPRNSMKCRKRNICWMTGRSRGFYRDFGLSRHVLREMSHQCLLPGIRKASW